MEKISIIVPIYNIEQYIEECIKSIVEQTYSNLEIILVDDGSTDNSGIICDKYAKQDNRIIVIHKNNEGVSSARNAGINASTSELISFIDGDDYVEKEFIAILYDIICSTGADISACCSFGVRKQLLRTEYSKETTIIYNVRGVLKNILENGDFGTGPCNKLYRKKIFTKVKFPQGKVYEDLYVLPSILKQTNSLAYNPVQKYFYRYTLNSSTNREFSLKKFDIINAMELMLKFVEEETPEYTYLAIDMALDSYASIALQMIKAGKDSDRLNTAFNNMVKKNNLHFFKAKISLKKKCFICLWMLLGKKINNMLVRKILEA